MFPPSRQQELQSRLFLLEVRDYEMHLLEALLQSRMGNLCPAQCGKATAAPLCFHLASVFLSGCQTFFPP